MTAKLTRRCKFTQLVADHVLGYVNRNKLITIMHGNCMPNKVWRYHGCTCPRLHNAFLSTLIHCENFFLQRNSDVRTFLQ